MRNVNVFHIVEEKAGLVAQSVMSATGMQDIRMYMSCLPQILIWDSGFVSALYPRMLVTAFTCLCVGIIQHLLVMAL